MSETPPPARSAWQAFLARFPATVTVDLVLPDLVGIARGKRLTAAGFAGGLEGGLSLPGSLYGMDSTGANVDASGLIWEEGDPDRPCLVDPSTFAPVPWRAGGA
ncbi:MAG: glutamine synthetase family protein, partial [Geminicoccaceae bacterium]